MRYETQGKVYTGHKKHLQQSSTTNYVLCLAFSLENVPLQQILTGTECQNIFMYLVVTPCSNAFEFCNFFANVIAPSASSQINLTN